MSPAEVHSGELEHLWQWGPGEEVADPEEERQGRDCRDSDVLI